MIEPNPTNAAPPETDDLKEQVAALQRQITTLLLGLLILSGTLSVFLWRQSRYARADLESVKPTAAQIMQAYNQEKPAMEAFVAKVAEFGRTHPDFGPYMKKYNIQIPAAPVPTSAPPAAAAPAVPKK